MLQCKKNYFVKWIIKCIIVNGFIIIKDYRDKWAINYNKSNKYFYGD